MSDSTFSLSDARTGMSLIISEIHVQGVLRRRLLDLGFIRGATVDVLQRSPLGDPVAFRVNNTTIALRKEEASQIYGRHIGGVKSE